MVMRFYWGLGVGHVHSHDDAIINGPSEDEAMESEDEEDPAGTLEIALPLEVQEVQDLDGESLAEENVGSSGILEELLEVDDRDDEEWEDSEHDLEEDSEDHDSDVGDSGYGGMDSTY